MATNKKLEGLEDLYADQLKDIYDAEKQLIEALPKMAQAATSADLRQGFEMHLDETREHLTRLKDVLSRHSINPGNKKCEAMQGLIAEGEHAINLRGNDMVRDAALIAAAQRVEHYEIATYGTLRAFANHLDYGKDKALFQKTIKEEGRADKKLTDLAEGSLLSEGINERALPAD
jgi:ferritin-like metal-binding protein YciE